MTIDRLHPLFSSSLLILCSADSGESGPSNARDIPLEDPEATVDFSASDEPEGPSGDDAEAHAEGATILLTESEHQKLLADLERYRDIALRSQADLDNYRKRMVRELEEGRRYANNDLLERLLPIVDNFELGLMAAKQSSDQNIFMGMAMVQRQLADFLESSGLTAISAEGQPFDPKLHEAVAQETSETVPVGQVIRQTRKGYRQGERLLRAANVVVSTGVPENAGV